MLLCVCHSLYILPRRKEQKMRTGLKISKEVLIVIGKIVFSVIAEDRPGNIQQKE